MTIKKYSPLCLLACCVSLAHAQTSEVPFENDLSHSEYKAVLAPALLGAGPDVLAVVTGENLLTLYGSVDLAVNYINAGGNSLVRMQSGNVWTSKFGIYGQEDLGRKWTAFFRLESGFYANTGAVQSSTSLFNRGAFVGLQNPDYGQLSMGNQLTSIATALLVSDVYYVNAHDAIFSYLASASGLGTGSSLAYADRVRNTIRYVTPRVGGANLDLSYSFKSDQTPGPAVYQRSIALNYSHPGTTITLSYGQSWCDPSIAGSCTGSATVAPTIRQDNMVASIVHDFGPVIGQFAYLRTDPKLAGDGLANLYIGGIQKMWHGNLLRASLGYRATTIDKDYAYGTTLGIDHFLSRRTAVYARLGWLHNGPDSNLTYDFDSTSSPTLVGNGHSVTSATIGMYTNF
ncbi:porin [Paraburkholderia fungorum]